MVSLKDKAYDIIKEKIVTCELLPGDTIDEKELINITGCGRTPVREALNILAREGLVRIVPRRGMFVTDVSIKDICDIFELKQELESLIVRLYCNKLTEDQLLRFKEKFSSDMDAYHYTLADAEFHTMITDACDNKYYKLIMDIVSDQSQRIRMLTNEEPQQQKQSSKEHLIIINAILEKDYEKAAEVMGMHYRNSLDNIMKYNTVSVFLKR